jgi:hypothetical protein
MPKKEVQRALEDVKRLEDEDIPSDEDIAEQYENDMAKAAAALKLLRPMSREPVSRRKTTSKRRRK